ncbi:DNA-binding protein [Robertmurraya sp. GLU-23]
MMSGTKTEFPKLAKPAIRALEGAGFYGLEQLTEVEEEELVKLHGMGPKAIEQLRLVLLEKGWKFREK